MGIMGVMGIMGLSFQRVGGEGGYNPIKAP